MDIKNNTHKTLKENELRAKKHLGQNFLISEKALNKIVNAGEISESDFVLEIGPGTGNLTRLLYQKTKNFLALEKDTDMTDLLKEFPVEFTDAMQFDPANLPAKYKVVANIPYYITSPLINHFLKDEFKKGENGNPPSIMVLLVQKEVAEKICDPTHNSFLSIGIRAFGKPSLVGIVKKGCFVPMPKVDSAILKIEVYPEPLITCDLDQYFKVCSMACANPRKKLSNNLKQYIIDLGLTPEEFTAKTGVDLNLRAEKLSPQDFERMVI